MIRGRAKKIHPVIVYSPIREYLHTHFMQAAIELYVYYDSYSETEEVMQRIINEAKRLRLENSENKN